MEVFIRDEDKEKYESFSLMGYYHTSEENTDLKECLIQDIWVSDDDENLPRLTLKSLDQHDSEVRKQERKQVIAELREWVKDKSYKVLEPPTDNEEEFKYVYDYEASSKFSLEEKLTELENK